jgi:hypothetical protein
MYQLTIEPFTYPVSRLKADAKLFKEHGRTKTNGPLSAGDMALVSLSLTKETTRPDITSDRVATRDESPTIVDGASVFGWTVRDKTAAELTSVNENAAAAVRSKRTRLLENTDWTQLADSPEDAATWATYRQALRDITKHPSFPHLSDNDWPVKSTTT